MILPPMFRSRFCSMSAVLAAVLQVSGCRGPDADSGTLDSTTGSQESSDESSSSSMSTDDGTDGSSSTSEDAACSEPQPASQSSVVLSTPTGTIAGTWFSPEGCPPFPTVVFHVGSGPTDRDGNSAVLQGRNDGHLQLAEHLQQAGWASLRFDKRGIAASAGAVEDWSTVVLQRYVDDLRAWVELLRTDAALVGPITLLGHSEGSLISTLAAKEIEVEALLLVAAPGRPFGDVLRTQLQQNLDDPELLAQALEILDELEAGNLVRDVPPSLSSLFAPQSQPFLVSLLARDPAGELAGVSGPVRIIAGTADVQTPVSEAEVLAAAKADAELRIIENMTHVFKDAGQGQDAAYNDPEVPLADGLVEAVIEFLPRE